MNSENTRTFAMVSTRPWADRVVKRLHRAGFEGPSVLQELVQPNYRMDFKITGNSQATEAAKLGSALGALAGALTAVAAFVLPSVDQPTVGPLVLLCVATALGAVGFGLIGALLGYALPQFRALHLAAVFAGGGVVITVDTPSKEARARAQSVLRFERVVLMQRRAAVKPVADENSDKPAHLISAG